MPIDLSKLREDAGKLAQPAPPRDEESAQRRQLQAQRGALNAEGMPPGAEPEVDPIDAAIVEGHGAGGRGSDRAMEAYLNRVIPAAAAGDPRVSSQGVVNAETRERWMEDAHQRQIRNRDQSGMAHR